MRPGAQRRRPHRGGAKKTAHNRSAAEALAPKKAAPKNGGRESSTPPPQDVPFTHLQLRLMVMDQLMEKGVIHPFSLKKVERECGKKRYVGANSYVARPAASVATSIFVEPMRPFSVSAGSHRMMGGGGLAPW